MTNILVVLGAEYIGSTVAAHLVKAGHRVTVFDQIIMQIADAVPHVGRTGCGRRRERCGA